MFLCFRSKFKPKSNLILEKQVNKFTTNTEIFDIFKISKLVLWLAEIRLEDAISTFLSPNCFCFPTPKIHNLNLEKHTFSKGLFVCV
jgi:hypothetical protein